MSKAAIIQLTKNLAVEWARSVIRVNCVAPGLIKTSLTEFWDLEENKKGLELYLERVPLKRAGKPEEISSVIAFLAIPLSSYINGQCIKVDGGFMINEFSLK
jgi:Tropinone reductase 1